jgi:FemAB-related protein (PEP-CTERM system-associated)
MIGRTLISPDWTTFVEQQTGDVPIYYSPAWLDLISTLYGYSIIPLTSVNGSQQITGFLPLCFMSSPLTGSRLVSLPFSDHCPLLAVDESSANDLIEQAVRLARQKNVRYLELRTGVNESFARRKDMVEGNLYVRWVLPLLTDPDARWAKLRKPVQRQIKKALNAGLQVRLADRREDLEHYYRLHLQTRCKKHGMPAQPRRFFYNLWDAFSASGAIQLLLAEYQGNLIAGMILLASGTTVRYAYGASEERYLSLAPNNLLMWTAITWASEHGYQTLDLGRTAIENEGLMEFKRRWGASPEALPYYYYPRKAGLAATSENSWRFRLLTACWSKLPLTLTGSLGSVLYKHLG